MSKSNLTARRFAAAVVAGCIGFAMAGTAGAVDLRDWGRTFNTASERYVVLASFGNQAVLDKETQLVWQRSAGAAVTWTSAVIACKASHAAGRMGWRLPSTSELTSLVDGSRKLPAGHPFQNVQPGYYWSSTDQTLHGAAYADLKELLSYGIAFSRKTNTYPYVCVRGGGAADR